MSKKALGKGLSAIISTSPHPAEDLEKEIIGSTHSVIEIPVEDILPNPDQPRERFNEDDLTGLSDSIRSVGLIQPIIVRHSGDKYMVVAGERRLRAAKAAGLPKIKAIIIEVNEEENLTYALIENIQRSDLDPVEEAKAYRILVNRFKMRQQDIAEKVGKDRATIANSLRILNLPDEVLLALVKKKISAGHAKVLVGFTGKKLSELFNETVKKSLSVRDLEKLAHLQAEGNAGSPSRKSKDPHIRKMEEELISKLGTKVEIRHSSGKGKIEISYYSLDDFERIIDLIK
jgi:ParB family chromosome partitioning protein